MLFKSKTGTTDYADDTDGRRPNTHGPAEGGLRPCRRPVGAPGPSPLKRRDRGAPTRAHACKETLPKILSDSRFSICGICGPKAFPAPEATIGVSVRRGAGVTLSFICSLCSLWLMAFLR